MGDHMKTFLIAVFQWGIIIAVGYVVVTLLSRI